MKVKLHTLLFSLLFTLLAYSVLHGLFPLSMNPVEVQHKDPELNATISRRSCALMPVYRNHFENLYIRLKLSIEYSVTKLPPHYIVFDHEGEIEEFCLTFGGSLCNHESLHFLSLRSLVGHSSYNRLEAMKTDPSKPTAYTKDGCHSNTNHITQALKKLYGSKSLIGECDTVWVADVESVPFRPFDMNKQFSFTNNFIVLSSWYHNRWGCNFELNWYDDFTCEQFLAADLGLDKSYDYPSSGFDIRKKGLQTIWDFNNWWNYNPIFIERIDQLVKRKRNQSIADYYTSPLLSSDASFHSHLAEYFAAIDPPLSSSSVTIKNFPEELEKLLPDTFSKCCNCAITGVEPCREITALWSDCFQESGVTPVIAAKFLVEELGIFGIFSMYWDSAPVDIFQDNRISFCISNCNHDKFAQKFKGVEEFSSFLIYHKELVEKARTIGNNNKSS